MPRGRVDGKRGREGERYRESQRYWERLKEEEKEEGRKKQELAGRRREEEAKRLRLVKEERDRERREEQRRREEERDRERREEQRRREEERDRERREEQRRRQVERERERREEQRRREEERERERREEQRRREEERERERRREEERDRERREEQRRREMERERERREEERLREEHRREAGRQREEQLRSRSPIRLGGAFMSAGGGPMEVPNIHVDVAEEGRVVTGQPFKPGDRRGLTHCRAIGCSYLGRRLKQHARFAHIPSVLSGVPGDYYHGIELKIMAALCQLAEWVLGRGASLNQLVIFVNANMCFPDIRVGEYQFWYERLCAFFNQIPSSITFMPNLQSPYLLMHWRILLELIRYIGPESCIKFKNFQ